MITIASTHPIIGGDKPAPYKAERAVGRGSPAPPGCNKTPRINADLAHSHIGECERQA